MFFIISGEGKDSNNYYSNFYKQFVFVVWRTYDLYKSLKLLFYFHLLEIISFQL